MKKFVTVLSLLSLTAASGAYAQSTTQQAVLGASADPVYSVRVQGANDVIYNCKPDTTRDAAGTLIRECVRADEDTAGVFTAGEGIGNAGPAIAGAIVAVAVIAGGSDSDADSDSDSGPAE
ncbi:hypothetical protein ABMC89_03805 [Sulfitobacter sp. HNIBRBA3233]|uniref:hypothetical protein n=1 Tax=Sulfitobacter marinivivus TaxID=3158558 RepID=UPI0032E01342